MDKARRTILLVDDNATNLTMGKEILKENYKVYPIPSAEIMFDLIENVTPDMILLDIEMPEMDGYEAIKKLKANPALAEIPVIFLTSKIDEGSELEGLSLGAIDYVAKPFSAPLLLKRIENHLFTELQKKQLKEFNNNLEEMVNLKTAQVLNLQNAVLSTVADLVEFRDDVTGGHIARTQRYLKILLDEILAGDIYADERANWEMNYLLPSAQLHDVGKIAISDLILNKPGKLTPEEFEIMKTHVVIGVKAIRKIEQNAEEHSFLRHARLIAGGHHEKWDGSGYPAGLRGRDIPLEGRLMAIADVYDALVSTRPYKRPMSIDEARAIIEAGSGAHFDPILTDVFSKTADKFAEVVKDSII
ncbi:MAG: response regulator [Synergistaceae bacterium]|jgi:putative two-component system response regulator|nr:response regulator [Synergistaceae bacterium]